MSAGNCEGPPAWWRAAAVAGVLGLLLLSGAGLLPFPGPAPPRLPQHTLTSKAASYAAGIAQQLYAPTGLRPRPHLPLDLGSGATPAPYGPSRWAGPAPGTTLSVQVNASRTTGPAPLTVGFQPIVSGATSGGAFSYSVTFGDGTGSNGTFRYACYSYWCPDPPLQHTYTAPGRYSVSLTVTNSTGQGLATQTISAHTVLGPGGWVPVSPSSAPSPRLGAAAAYDPAIGKVLLFGGQGTTGALSDTWTYAGGTWTNISSTLSTVPPSRYGGLMTYDSADQEILLVGGTVTGPTNNDTWTFSGGTWSPGPQFPRFLVGWNELVDDPADGYVILTGMMSTQNGVNQACATWSFRAAQWHYLGTDQGCQWDPEAFDSMTGQVLSLNGNGSYSAHTFSGGSYTDVYLPTEPTWAGFTGNAMLDDASAGALVLPEMGFNTWWRSHNATWAYWNGQWTDLTTLSAQGPAMRTGAALAYDAADGYDLLFGGGNISRTFGDTWAFSVDLGLHDGLTLAPSNLTLGGSTTLHTVVRGGTAPFTYAYGGLPSGCAGANLAWLNCTPTAQGSYWINATVSDAVGNVSWSVALLTVGPIAPLSATLRATPSTLTVGQPLQLQATASGGTPPYGYAYAGLPPGCASANARWVNCTPSVAGSYNVSVDVSDTQGGLVLATTLVIVQSLPGGLNVQLTANPASLPLGFTSSLHASVSGGVPPYTYSFSGLPSGCTGQNSSWLNCTPGVRGSFSVVVNVSAGGGSATGSAATWLTVVPPSSLAVQLSAAPPNLTLGQSTTLHAVAVGGTPPYTYRYSALPAGCSIGGSAWGNCTPSTTGTWTPLVYVVDAVGANASAPSRFPITVVLGPLTAGAAASPTNGPAPLSVQFAGSATGGNAPYAWSWSFGDGSAGSAAQDPSHVYNASGAFPATLTVVDARGDLALANVSITVGQTGVLVAPTATPSSGPSPLNVTFDANPSGGTAPYTVTWDFGDGTGGSGVTALHRYANPGSYNATVNATDSLGRSAHGRVTVYVAPSGCGGCPLSVVVGAAPVTGTAPVTVLFWANASGGTGPYSTTWTFGDGGSGSGTPVAHPYSAAGNYTATATVVDAQRSIATGTFVLRIAGGGSAPLQVTGGVTPRGGDAPLNVSFIANVTGGSLPYTVQWSFGDGTNGSGIAGAWSYHLYLSSGTYVAGLVVTDGAGRQVVVQLPAVHVNASGSATPHPAANPAVWLLAGAGLGAAGMGIAVGVIAALTGRRRTDRLRVQGEEMVEAMRRDMETSPAPSKHDRSPPPP